MNEAKSIWQAEVLLCNICRKCLSIQEESEIIGREGIFTYNLFEIDNLQFCMLFSQPEWLWSLLC